MPNHYSCAICGATPAAYLAASSAAARFLWWNRQLFAQPACAICAEQIYLAAQKRNGRQGWWGIVSFFYTVFSAIRNKLSIEAHRKSIPYIAHEGELYSRPKLHIRNDTPTVIASIGFVLLMAFLIIYSAEASKPIPRNSQGQVTAKAQADWTELKLGDCVTTAGEGGNIASLEVTPCSRAHSWQVYGVGETTGTTFNSKAVSAEAKKICQAAQDAIDTEITDAQKVDLHALDYLPTEASWANGDRGVTCLVGNSDFNFSTSFLK